MSRDQPMEQREQKLNLFGLCRVVTEEDEVKLAWAMPWRENEGEANGYGNQSFDVYVDTACCLNYHQTVIMKKVGTICYLSIINQEQNVPT